MPGALLLATAPVWAQAGAVVIRVTDPTGSVVPTAAASLLGANDRPVRTLTANGAGEILWNYLPLGERHFWVSAPVAFVQPITAAGADPKEQVVEARLGPVCTRVEAGTEVNTIHMPYSDSLDLAPAPTLASPQQKPAKHRW